MMQFTSMWCLLETIYLYLYLYLYRPKIALKLDLQSSFYTKNGKK